MFKGKKGFTQHHKNGAGFTLIELLVVIGILGILAIGLLAAIDPFEQLKKGRDTNLRNVTVEYVNAVTRYYATHGDMPWKTSPPTALTFDNATVVGYTASLVAEGELKPEFQSALGDNAKKLYLTGKTTPTIQAIVCFDPDSKSISADTTTKYDLKGDPASPCGVGNICYWCAR